MQSLFPFDNFRKGQESFYKVTKTALKHKKDVLAQVPTGVGKTAAVLGAALNYSLGEGKKILFLTSKHTHHRIAVETLKKIKNKYDIKLQVADFIGKIWMCSRQEIDPRNAKNFRDYCKHLVDNQECNFYENFYNKSRFFNNKLLQDELKIQEIQREEAIEFNEKIKTHNTKVDTLIEQKRYFLARQELLNNDILNLKSKIKNLNILRKAFSTTGIVAFKLENLTKNLKLLSMIIYQIYQMVSFKLFFV